MELFEFSDIEFVVGLVFYFSVGNVDLVVYGPLSICHISITNSFPGYGVLLLSVVHISIDLLHEVSLLDLGHFLVVPDKLLRLYLLLIVFLVFRSNTIIECILQCFNSFINSKIDHV